MKIAKVKIRILKLLSTVRYVIVHLPVTILLLRNVRTASDEPNSNQVVTPTPSTMVNEIGAELQACTPVADETMDEITSSSENDTESTSEIDFLEETAADLNTKMSERSFF